MNQTQKKTTGGKGQRQPTSTRKDQEINIHQGKTEKTDMAKVKTCFLIFIKARGITHYLHETPSIKKI